jgi:hypothetical protein
MIVSRILIRIAARMGKTQVIPPDIPLNGSWNLIDPRDEFPDQP